MPPPQRFGAIYLMLQLKKLGRAIKTPAEIDGSMAMAKNRLQ
jgi:hypothetical protein